MPINVSEAIDSDTAEIITVERAEVGGYVDGLYVPGVTSTFKTICSVQAPSPDELQTLAEGERNKDVRKFISKKPLRTTQDRDDTIADVVIYDGFRFKIISSGNWSVYGHTTAFGARE